MRRNFLTCPLSSTVYAVNNVGVADWVEPTVTDPTAIITSNYLKESNLSPGVYSIIYVATDANGNISYCMFYLYVIPLGFTCSQPKFMDEDSHGTNTCTSLNSPFSECTPKCFNGGIFLEPHPNIYTCGPSGTYDYKMNKKTLIYPKCYIPPPTSIEMKIRIRYDGIDSCNQANQNNAIKNHFCNKFNKLNKDWGTSFNEKSGFCPNEDCCTSDRFILTTMCYTNENLNDLDLQYDNILLMRRRRSTIEDSLLVLITLLDLQELMYSANTAQDIETILYNFLRDENAADMTDMLPNASPQSLVFNPLPICEPGQIIINYVCVDCPIGTYFSDGDCYKCQIGAYQQNVKSIDCTSCVSDKTTLFEGSSDVTDCIDKCIVGMYNSYSTVSGVLTPECTPCPIGQYQNIIGQLSCIACTPDKTTTSVGSNSINLCIYICESGSQPNLDQTSCDLCPIGSYRTQGIQINCESCDENWTTANVGATSVIECNIKVCAIGYYLDIIQDQCYPCPRGTYQDIVGQFSCISCTFDKTTINTASTHVDQCLPFCEPGKFQEIGNSICFPCLQGTYKNNDIPNNQCVSCIAPLFTLNDGAISITQCNVLKCPAGTQGDSIENKCVSCEIGFFKDNDDVNNNCLPCSIGFVTPQIESTNSDDCNVAICDVGKQNIAGSCESCPIGFYRNEIMKADPNKLCDQCPDTFTTLNENSISLSDCSVRQCSEGQKESLGECVSCPIGTYKDNNNVGADCISCPTSLTTLNTGSTKDTDCNLKICDPGYQDKNGLCSACSMGFYKDNSEVNNYCLSCPMFHTTKSIASISLDDCSVHICPIGFELIVYECSACKIGFYKSVTGNDELCKPCGANTSTKYIGSISITECNILLCDPGTEEVDGVCVDCKLGTYKDNNFAFATCQNCPEYYTTLLSGSTDSDMCILHICLEGYEEINERCEPCNIGYYKNNREPNILCTACTSPRTTRGVGSTSEFECSLIACQEGYHEVAGQCIPCIIGYYKSNSLANQYCLKCVPNYTTITEGSTSELQCSEHYCEKGYEEDINLNCIPCKVGYYKDNNLPTKKCLICQINLTTISLGSTSKNSCSIVVCPLGEESINNVCYPCQKGFYKSNSDVYVRCTPCDYPYTTLTLGSISVLKCDLLMCRIGYENINNQCEPCKIGFYKNNDDPLNKCDKCDNTYTTYSVGSTSVLKCNLRLCGLGKEEFDGFCRECEVGSFNDKNDVSSKCIKCPPNYITLTKGSIMVEMCDIFVCDIGYEPDETSTTCIPCKFGFYKDKYLPDYKCVPCNIALTTEFMASTSINDCNISKCKIGYELINNICNECKKGFYKDNDDTFGKCLKCQDEFTTESTGSDNILDCNLHICINGYESISGVCTLCSIGYYKDNEDPLKFCVKCLNSYTTAGEGSISSNQCNLKQCKEGFEEFGGMCVPCKVGYYKNNNIPLNYCIACPPTFTTIGQGSTLEIDCSIQKCGFGFESFLNTCTPCPMNKFKDNDYSDIMCTDCPETFITGVLGAKSKFECNIQICPAGQESINNICTFCKIGFYKDTELPHHKCLPCPPTFTTLNVGSILEEDCNIQQCNLGMESVLNSCLPCEIGTYKDTINVGENCKNCPDTFTTSITGSKSLNDCNIQICPFGYESINNICKICNVGHYKDNNLPHHTCLPCPTSYTTVSFGSNSIDDCNVLQCGIGMENIIGKCMPCQLGTFKDNDIIDEACKDCPATFTTDTIGAESIHDCYIQICPPGQESINNLCRVCQMGYYKDNNIANHICLPCPNTFTTDNFGSTSVDDCNIQQCGLGMESIFDRCLPCPIGKYKDNDIIGEVCQNCPETFITGTIGSKSAHECYIQICPVGQESISNVCKLCKIGYYKDNDLPNHNCLPCPFSFTTFGVGSTTIDDCSLQKCGLGMESVFNKCTPCPIGTYKNNDIIGEGCQDCPTTFITEIIGAKSVS
ncbi:hypothetical protein A3Q56_06657, partial [Intoshia linei]